MWRSIFYDRLILNLIAQKLPLISVMSLKRALPGLDQYLIFSVYDRAITALKEMTDGGAIDDLLGETATFTGSAILKIVTGDAFDPGDIDYCIKPPVLTGNKWDTMALPLVTVDSNAYSYSGLLKGVAKYRDQRCAYLYFNLLLVSDVDTYIESFDFSFLRISLDQRRLIIHNPFDVLRRRCRFRLTDYIPRELSNAENFYHNFLPSRYLRLLKYVQRGYDIMILCNMANRHLTTKIFTERNTHKSILDTVVAYWQMFWMDRVDDNRSLIAGRYPTWKNGSIPTFYNRNL